MENAVSGQVEGSVAKRGPGRPVNPDSKRQKEIRRKAAEAAA